MVLMEKKAPIIAKAISSQLTKHYPAGQIIVYQGDMPEDVYILKRGVIKIYDTDEDGNEKILHLVKPYAVIPFTFFSGEYHPIKWYYSALTNCEVVVIPSSVLSKKLENNKHLANYLMCWFTEQVHELLVRLSSLGKTTARDKVVAALKFLAVRHSYEREGGWRRIEFHVSHQLIADLAGVSREHVAGIMREIGELNLIRYPRKTVLEIDLKKLIEWQP